jgi:hypothetical protein
VHAAGLPVINAATKDSGKFTSFFNTRNIIAASILKQGKCTQRPCG